MQDLQLFVSPVRLFVSPALLVTQLLDELEFQSAKLRRVHWGSVIFLQYRLGKTQSVCLQLQGAILMLRYGDPILGCKFHLGVYSRAVVLQSTRLWDRKASTLGSIEFRMQMFMANILGLYRRAESPQNSLVPARSA
jgi:hypothetical protein